MYIYIYIVSVYIYYICIYITYILLDIEIGFGTSSKTFFPTNFGCCRLQGKLSNKSIFTK